MKEIKIAVNKQGKWDVNVSKGLRYEEAIHICLNGLYAIANSFVKAGKGNVDDTKRLRGLVYDSLNLAFSNFLTKFDPSAKDPQFDEAVLMIAQRTAQELMQKSVDTGVPFKELLKEYEPSRTLS